MFKSALFLIISWVLFALTSANPNRIVCYYGSWAVYRTGDGKFSVDNIDPTLCTHLIYTFVGITKQGKVEILDYQNDIVDGAIAKFNALKVNNPNLKTIVAVGGWNEGSVDFSYVAADASLRRKFAVEAADFCLLHGFDGFDIDWEFPAQRGGSSSDKYNLGLFLEEVRLEFDKHNLILTIAVLAPKYGIDISYDVPTISKYVHWINLMAYDLHGTWEGRTGQNTPLYPSDFEVTAFEKQWNVDACVRAWLNAGAPADKLVMGIALYGRTFTLSSSDTSIGAPISGPGWAGPYTLQPGILGYNEIVLKFGNGGWTKVWNERQQVPYAYKGDQWVGYDDPKSVLVKVDYAKSKGLGGFLVWSIETDDFLGLSGEKFQLLSTLRKSLDGASPVPTTTLAPTTTTVAPTTTTVAPTTMTHAPTTTTTTLATTTQEPITTTVPTTQAPTTQAPTTQETNTDDECTEEGYFRSTTDCSVYYYCSVVSGGFRKYEMYCPEGLYYSLEMDSCNYPHLVDC